MPFSYISSKDNPSIKLASSIKDFGRSRRENGLFLIEGLRLCRDAAENRYKFSHLFFTETAQNKYPETVDLLADVSDKCFCLSDSAFKKISDTNTPQGIACLCKMPVFSEGIKKTGRYIALENLQDPSNLGAVARSAEAFGMDGIIVSDNGCDPFSPKALRASMGALLRIPVFVFDDFTNKIKTSGLKAYACVVTPDAKSIEDICFTDGVVAIIGNEANGITKETAAIADAVTIRMTGKAESLNAAVAASVVMWEMQR